MPEPTVVATAVPKVKAATKLKNAAQMTALPGLSTRVDTTVAIEFAASWKPLMKSKVSATRISATTASVVTVIDRSGVLHDDPLEDVGDVLAAVGGLFEEVQDLLPLDDFDRVLLFREEGADGRLKGAVRLVLEAVDLDRPLRDAFAAFERLDRVDDLLGGIEDDARQLARPRTNALDVVQADDRRRRVDRVHDVVERARERVDVLAVERRDERAVQALNDLVGQEVALVLDFLDLVGLVPDRARRLEHVQQQPRAVPDLLGERVEVVVEPRFSRD